MIGIELINRASTHSDRRALMDGDQCVSYRVLLDRSALIASGLLQQSADLCGERIALFLPAGLKYILAQWAVWRSGGIVVPLNIHAGVRELEYALTAVGVTRLITNPAGLDKVAGIADENRIVLLQTETLESHTATSLPEVADSRMAMILFTSGTTARPKGVVSTHVNINAQVECLVKEWQWQADDCIPGFLPMHHIHGIVNVVNCALWTGACIDFFPAFNIDSILERVTLGRYTIFMAVPTIYVKLIQHLRTLPGQEMAEICSGFTRMRLMVSGSAALSVTTHREWSELTGQVLLERYGMTEIGMALSNPLHGERRPGTVGQALPGVELQLADERGGTISGEHESGEIRVRGAMVFDRYWDNPQATREAFSNGWFMTGDMAVLEDGYYRIMGRLSVDIIKSGGYKLSALEIEEVLLTHPAITECAVVGVDDPTWGEAVAAAVVLKTDAVLDLATLRSWMKTEVSPYKIPKQLLILDQLPRNAMGKVTKPDVKQLVLNG